jgi:hypothetical protein
MQVVVFISKANGEKKNLAPILLVLPNDPGAAIPKHLQPIDWNYFATVSVTDALLGASPEAVTADLERYGYSLVSPTH